MRKLTAFESVTLDGVDEVVLQVHPLVLGQGKRLFEPGTTLADFELVKSVATPKGVVINTYRPRVSD